MVAVCVGGEETGNACALLPVVLWMCTCTLRARMSSRHLQSSAADILCNSHQTPILLYQEDPPAAGAVVQVATDLVLNISMNFFGIPSPPSTPPLGVRIDYFDSEQQTWPANSSIFLHQEGMTVSVCEALSKQRSFKSLQSLS